jgi:hypothetical protein
MFNPKEIQQLKQQLKDLQLDRATLEKAARALMEIPELSRVLEQKSFDEGFKRRVDGLYEEVQNVFDDHEEPPDGCEKK